MLSYDITHAMSNVSSSNTRGEGMILVTLNSTAGGRHELPLPRKGSAVWRHWSWTKLTPTFSFYTTADKQQLGRQIWSQFIEETEKWGSFAWSWTGAHAGAQAPQFKTGSHWNQSELSWHSKCPMNARYSVCKAGLPSRRVGDSRKRRSNACTVRVSKTRGCLQEIHAGRHLCSSYIRRYNLLFYYKSLVLEVSAAVLGVACPCRICGLLTDNVS